MNKILPEVSTWYQDLVSGTLFEVVAVDDVSSSIEYQMVDGELGEYDFNTWRLLYICKAEAPEDWRSSYELSHEDQAYPDQVFVPDNFSGALQDIEPDAFDQGDDFQTT
jgi:hypothetical protein